MKLPCVFFHMEVHERVCAMVFVGASNKYHRTCKMVENTSNFVTNIKDLNV